MCLEYGLRTALVTACGLLGQAAANAALETTPLIPLGGKGVERGVVLIRCATDTTDVIILSRGAVLDLGLSADDGDLVLTAAHGLPAEGRAVLRQCRVLGGRGRPYRIAEVFRAAVADEPHGQSHDWAVLLVKHRLGGHVGRLRPVHVTADGLMRLATEEAPVRLLLRQADVRQGDCRLMSPGVGPEEFADTMVYSCRSVPGLSGSPILTSMDGRMVVIGIHLGWGLLPIDGGRLRVISMGRPIDAEITSAITAAVAAARR